MTAKNDITGDSIRTKGLSNQQYRDNYDAIFGKKDKEVKPNESENLNDTPISKHINPS